MIECMQDKLRRLIRHLNYKEIAKKMSSQNKQDEDEAGLDYGNILEQ